MPIGQQCLVDEAVEDAVNAIVAVQGHAHANVANVECRPIHAPAQKRANAHFVKI
jgi:hypothetical protein